MRIQTGRLVWPSLLLIAACQDREPPPTAPEDPSLSQQTPDERPFYYYQDQPIYLVVDPTQIIVQGDETVVRSALTDAASRVGVIAEITSAKRDHRFVALSGSSVQQTEEIVTQLSNDGRLEFVSRAYRTEDGGHPFLPVNRIDVALEPGGADRVPELIASFDLSLVREPQPDSGFFTYAFAYPRGSDPLVMARQLHEAEGVDWADPDRLSDIRPTYVPSDPFYPLQFHFKNSITRFGIPVDINVEPAWDLTKGSGVRVAVIDDGVDGHHASSNGDLLAGCCGGMGYDLLWDPDVDEHAYTPCCNDTHGTSVAGIIWADHDNGNGGVGVAPEIVDNVVRIFRQTYPPESGPNGEFTQVATDNEIADGINWAWTYADADVINNSWGGGTPSQAITTAINNALTQGRGGLGTVVVFSAGNTSDRRFGIIGPVQYPATLSETTNVISVSAINHDGFATNYAPDGPEIDIVAPSGQDTGYCIGEVVTTDLFGARGCDDGPGGNVDYAQTFSGTSAAAPQVSGVAALLLSREPGLTVGQVKARILAGADDWGDPNTFGEGKLNAFNALAPLTISISGPGTIKTPGTYNWTCAASGGVGGYSYEWERSDDGGPYYSVGSSDSYSSVVSAGTPPFSLRCTVTSGTQTGSSTRVVGVIIP